MNQLIKSYAYRIQQRMEELDRLHCSQSTTDSDSVELGEYECGMLVLKYQGYTTTNEREMKYIGKLVERALQIYEFFKLRNQNQNLLTVI